ncbi:MAG: hypothetical protein AAGN82_02465 [Myxococcota bacterium]
MRPPPPPPPRRAPTYLVRRHLRCGWSTLVVFMLLGLVLEGLHAFKAGFYLDADVETRRLMWTLAHAHGDLVALIHLAFAATVDRSRLDAFAAEVASRLLLAATVLLPGGFFAGGIVVHGGDPGAGVLLAPVGAAALIAAAALCARASWRA